MKRTILLLSIIALGLISVACQLEEKLYHTAAEPLFSVSKDVVELGEPISFTDQSIPTTGTELVAWNWEFNFDNKEDAAAVSVERNPTYTYNEIGKFRVRLTVTDNNGLSASAFKDVTVVTPYSALAHAEFEFDVVKANINIPVNFTDKSIPAKGATINSWEWNFGDGTASAEQNPQHTYTSSGSFTITLSVKDSKGNNSTISHDIVVMDPADVISVAWRTPMLGAIENTVSPALSPDGKTVYMWADHSAATYDVVLKAVDVATGAEKWAYALNPEFAALNEGAGVRLVYSSPAVGPNGDIYVCARDLKNSGAARKSFMIAVKADGTKRWHYAFGIDANFNYVTPAIDANGNIYIGHLTNKPFEIAVLNPETGSKINSIPLELGVRSGISLDKNGNVYFCSTGSNGLFSYGVASGTMNWQYNTNFSTTGGGISIGADGTVYTVADGANGGVVSAVAPNGSMKWEYMLPGAAQYGGAVLGTDGTIYANGGQVVKGAVSGGVVALNPDGTLKWHFATEEDVNNCVPMVDNRGYVHFITDAGTYYVVNGDGALYGFKSLGNKSFSSPVMNASGEVLIAAQEGSDVAVSYIYKLDTGASSFAESAWPMKGQNPQRTHLQK